MERVQTKGGEKKKIQETNKSAIFQLALHEVHKRSKESSVFNVGCTPYVCRFCGIQ